MRSSSSSSLISNDILQRISPRFLGSLLLPEQRGEWLDLGLKSGLPSSISMIPIAVIMIMSVISKRLSQLLRILPSIYRITGSVVIVFIILELLHTFFSSWFSNYTVSSGLSIYGQKSLILSLTTLLQDEEDCLVSY